MKKDVEFIVGPSWVYVYAGNGVDRVLDQALRVTNPQAFWINKQRHEKAPKVDKFHRIYDRAVSRFPKGLLHLAHEALIRSGWKVNVIQTGTYTVPPDPIFWPDSFEPWDHQREAVEGFWDHEFGIMEIPTRGGKARIGMLAATRFTNHYPVIYFVTKAESKREIIAEWKADFNQGPAFSDAGDEPGLHVLTYQAGMNRDLSPYHFVIADEVHMTGAEKIHDCLMRCDHAWYRLGLTGTGEGRPDNKDIYITGAVGPACYEVPRNVLVAAGLCATAEIFMVEIPGTVDIDAGEWSGPGSGWRMIEKHGIIEYAPRTEALIGAALEKWKDGQLLVLVQRYEQGDIFAERLTQRLGYDVEFVNGKTKPKERKRIYEAFQSGAIKALVASSIFNDSVTFPDVKVLIPAPGGKSPIKTRQMLGRALTGEKDVIIIDSWDAQHRVLEKHSKARMKAYGVEGYNVQRLSLA